MVMYMKIVPYTINSSSTGFRAAQYLQNPSPKDCKERNSTKSKMMLAASLVGLGVLAATTLIMAKKGGKIAPKENNIPVKFKELKENYQRIITEFPEDKPYYETLAQGINLPKEDVFKLSSITGPAQLKSILQKASPQDFHLGENLEGAKNRTLRINLHNHTTASDGRLTPEEMINQGARWADEIAKTKGADGKPAFVLGITDHDTLDGAR